MERDWGAVVPPPLRMWYMRVGRLEHTEIQTWSRCGSRRGYLPARQKLHKHWFSMMSRKSVVLLTSCGVLGHIERPVKADYG